MPKKTKTSSFGSPGRVGHDASAFYAARLYSDLPRDQQVAYAENRLGEAALDRIINASAESMARLAG